MIERIRWEKRKAKERKMGKKKDREKIEIKKILMNTTGKV